MFENFTEEQLRTRLNSFLDDEQKTLIMQPVATLFPKYDQLSANRLQALGIETVADLVWTENKKSLLTKGLYEGPCLHIINCVRNQGKGLKMNMRQQMHDLLLKEKPIEIATEPTPDFKEWTRKKKESAATLN